MTTCPVVTPSWVTIDLDTTPPLLVIDAPGIIEPPDDWIVIVRANEDLGPVGMEFTDSLGTVTRVGFERVGPRTLAVRIPTISLASGAGELKVVARDRACNATTIVTTVVITRPRAFDVEFTIDTGLEATLTTTYAFDAEIGIDHSHDVNLTMDHAYETDTGIAAALDVTLEITDGG